MSNVAEFPFYNLYNIPEALRKLALEIERGEVPAAHCVVLIDAADPAIDLDYRAFGKDFPTAHAIGMCHVACDVIRHGRVE